MTGRPTDWSLSGRNRLAQRLEEQAGRLRRATAVSGWPSGSVYANTRYRSLDDGRWRRVADGALDPAAPDPEAIYGGTGRAAQIRDALGPETGSV